ncbi:MAG: ABC transporter permease [Acidobacteria bacterium]|nr:ABC transporter permease [Acidobacteriota bacterium]
MASISQPVPPIAVRGTSLWALAWRQMWRSRMVMVCGAVLAVVVVASVLAPWLAPYPYQETNLRLGATPPSLGHWMGTDTLGRDVFSRVLHGGQISLAVGFVGTLVSLVIGVLYGAIAGYRGGRADEWMMRFVDFLYALPYLFLVIILLVFFSQSILMLFVALGLVQWLTMARIVRGQVLSLKHAEFIEAAQLSGTGGAGILFRHLLPNMLGPIVVYATLTVPAVILQEAFLSFLGLGIQAPRSSWGTLISDGATVMSLFPWLVFFPAAVLAAVLFSLNFLGDGLRDALDPRLRLD